MEAVIQARISFAMRVIFFGALFLVISALALMIEPTSTVGKALGLALTPWRIQAVTTFLPIGVTMFIAGIMMHHDLTHRRY